MSGRPGDAEIAADIAALRREFGPSVVLAAHHYQRPEIVALADFVGDSYKLALEARKTDAEFIVLAGVRFMAESAAILARKGQAVLIPDPAAGCPMADMIDRPAAAKALENIAAVSRAPVVPVTYMNTYADVKSFTGEHDGAICTSSNAAKVVGHYLSAGKAVFFLPDYNLGRNTAIAMGIPDRQLFTVRKDGSIEGDGNPADGSIFLWDGYCHVHKRFTTQDVRNARERHPGIRVIVHPECDPKVVALADVAGSTELIYRQIKNSPPGTSWAVGTESSFVSRMAAEFADKTVMHLRVSTCLNMSRITLENLRSSLASIKDKKENNGLTRFPITVPDEYKRYAAAALNAMLQIVEAG